VTNGVLGSLSFSLDADADKARLADLVFAATELSNTLSATALEVSQDVKRKTPFAATYNKHASYGTRCASVEFRRNIRTAPRFL
jgi:hypothetical protein